MIAMPNQTDFSAALARADHELRRRRPEQAIIICEALLRHVPDAVEPRLMIARAEQMRHRPEQMLAQVDYVLTRNPAQFDARLMRIEALIASSDITQARRDIAESLKRSELTPDQLGRVAEIQTQLADHEAALQTLKRAMAASPIPERLALSLLYNLSSAHIALGQMDEAELVLDRLIEKNPSDYDAYYNRATVRTQTEAHNHIDALSKQLDRPNLPPMGEVQLAYALAKEREDLGQYRSSFEALTRGAKRRRENMAYKVEDDLNTINLLQEVFDAGFANTQFEGCPDERPIFIIGMPRSGTTLVDRIITSHSEAESVGEINDLPLAITRLSGPAGSKDALIRRSAKMDIMALGETYLKGFDGRGAFSRRVVDKTPANFLYLALIAKALPNARIIHMKRHPMASGYAMYKVLFRMGYPFSYDLEDIGRYYAVYHRLMAHWHRLFPDRILDVQYEDLVDDQEQYSRQIIAHCGLEWDDACLSFHKNAAPTSTASAAQVRRPLYRGARDLWRHHEDALQPLARIFETEGISCR